MPPNRTDQREVPFRWEDYSGNKRREELAQYTSGSALSHFWRGLRALLRMAVNFHRRNP